MAGSNRGSVKVRDRILHSLGIFIMPDLNEPSPFTTEGTTVRSFVKREASWNRASVALMHEPCSRTVSTGKVRFDEMGAVRVLRSVLSTRWLGDESLLRLRCNATIVTARVRRRACEAVRTPRSLRPTSLVPLARLVAIRDHR